MISNTVNYWLKCLSLLSFINGFVSISIISIHKIQKMIQKVSITILDVGFVFSNLFLPLGDGHPHPTYLHHISPLGFPTHPAVAEMLAGGYATGGAEHPEVGTLEGKEKHSKLLGQKISHPPGQK